MRGYQMPIQAIRIFKQNFSVINTLTKSNLISFKSSTLPDNFNKNNIELAEFDSSLSEEAKKQIQTEVDFILNNQDTLKPLGKGATGNVYRIQNVDGYEPNGVVVKIAHKTDRNDETGERQKAFYDFDDEINILKKAKPLKDNSQQYVGQIKLKDGRNAIVTTFIQGHRIDVKHHKLTEKSIESILKTLYQLDSVGILHRDLKKENIMVDDDDEAKIIDYGESVEIDLLDFNKNDSSNNFPEFAYPSNIQNFEDTFISPYYDELMSVDKQEAKRFYANYLEQKAKIVYLPRAQYLTDFLQANEDELDESQKAKISKMIKYLATRGEVLTSKHDERDVVDVELMRNQVTYLSELAYKNEVLLANPVANIALKTQALVSANQLESIILKKLSKPNNIDTYTYLKFGIEEAHYRQKKISSWLTGLVQWVCTCLSGDILSEQYKEIIKECAPGTNLDFRIPNITEQ